jgi:hypothetical protein
LPADPPPPDHPYVVLSIGLPGYGDGLHPVEAMNVYEAIPGASLVEAETPLAADASSQAEMAAQADAVCMSSGFDPDPALRTRIDALFETAATYAQGFSIRVRRR